MGGVLGGIVLPLSEAGEEAFLCLLGIVGGDGVDHGEVQVAVVDQVEGAALGDADRGEGEERPEDSLQGHLEGLVAAHVPDPLVQREVTLDVENGAATVDGGVELEVEGTELRDLLGGGELRGFLDCVGFDDAAESEDLVDRASGEVGDDRGGVRSLGDVALRLELDERLADDAEAGSELVGEAALDELFPLAEGAVEDGLANGADDVLANSFVGARGERGNRN